MIREIITFGPYFNDFLETVSQKVVEKIDYIFMLLVVEERISSRFIRHIEGTKGLYEIRIFVESNIYRVLMKEIWLYYSMAFRKKHRKHHKKK